MIYIDELLRTQSRNEPMWARWIEPIIVLARGIPARSRTLGRWAYCVAGITKNGQWYRLYPVPLEDGDRSIYPFDVIKPFIVKRHENGRPESCRINSWLIWKVGTIPISERQRILENTIEPGSFLHDDSWHNKTLGLIKPLSLQIHIREKATTKYFCDYPECQGHAATFFDALKIDAKGRKLIAPTEKLVNLLSQLEEEKLWFIVGTMRKHPQRWIVVEVLISPDETVIALQSWLISKIKRETSFI